MYWPRLLFVCLLLLANKQEQTDYFSNQKKLFVFWYFFWWFCTKQFHKTTHYRRWQRRSPEDAFWWVGNIQIKPAQFPELLPKTAPPTGQWHFLFLLGRHTTEEPPRWPSMLESDATENKAKHLNRSGSRKVHEMLKPVLTPNAEASTQCSTSIERDE